jgi:hypothetical protein
MPGTGLSIARRSGAASAERPSEPLLVTPAIRGPMTSGGSRPTLSVGSARSRPTTDAQTHAVSRSACPRIQCRG